jgi:hypothetical protein
MIVKQLLTAGSSAAERWIQNFDEQLKPWLILELWAPGVDLSNDGPMEKMTCKPGMLSGYQSRCQFVNSEQVGGSVNQEYLVVARVNDGYSAG